jgi:hypothetical protein
LPTKGDALHDETFMENPCHSEGISLIWQPTINYKYCLQPKVNALHDCLKIKIAIEIFIPMAI